MHWLERYALHITPKGGQHPVHYRGAGLPAFHGGRAFVLRFGLPLVMRGIHDLTGWQAVQHHAGGLACAAGRCACPDQWARCWADDIVSPARRLYAYVRDLDALSRNQTEDAR